ncbi:hypothetical protein GQ42DRAFT_44313 [Ramicandelaber brevisporus]|nr:hypothetical protein GQ42DRAFT_44313 [Ramicandelaber brevisporus]
MPILGLKDSRQQLVQQLAQQHQHQQQHQRQQSVSTPVINASDAELASCFDQVAAGHTADWMRMGYTDDLAAIRLIDYGQGGINAFAQRCRHFPVVPTSTNDDDSGNNAEGGGRASFGVINYKEALVLVAVIDPRTMSTERQLAAKRHLSELRQALSDNIPYSFVITNISQVSETMLQGLISRHLMSRRNADSSNFSNVNSASASASASAGTSAVAGTSVNRIVIPQAATAVGSSNSGSSLPAQIQAVPASSKLSHNRYSSMSDHSHRSQGSGIRSSSDSPALVSLSTSTSASKSVIRTSIGGVTPDGSPAQKILQRRDQSKANPTATAAAATTATTATDSASYVLTPALSVQPDEATSDTEMDKERKEASQADLDLDLDSDSDSDDDNVPLAKFSKRRPVESEMFDIPAWQPSPVSPVSYPYQHINASASTSAPFHYGYGSAMSTAIATLQVSQASQVPPVPPLPTTQSMSQPVLQQVSAQPAPQLASQPAPQPAQQSPPTQSVAITEQTCPPLSSLPPPPPQSSLIKRPSRMDLKMLDAQRELDKRQLLKAQVQRDVAAGLAVEDSGYISVMSGSNSTSNSRVGSGYTTWKRRWYVRYGGTVYLYLNETSSSPSGSIALSDITRVYLDAQEEVLMPHSLKLEMSSTGESEAGAEEESWYVYFDTASARSRMLEQLDGCPKN